MLCVFYVDVADLTGTDDLRIVKNEALDRIRELLFGSVRLGMRQRLCKRDGALGADHDVVGRAVIGLLDVVGHLDRNVSVLTDAAVSEHLPVVGVARDVGALEERVETGGDGHDHLGGVLDVMLVNLLPHKQNNNKIYQFSYSDACHCETDNRQVRFVLLSIRKIQLHYGLLHTPLLPKKYSVSSSPSFHWR